MKEWEEFEKAVETYLNQNFGEYASFTLLGGSNSTKSDILVKPKTKQSFYIDAKHSPAQCGQFVLLPNIEKREYIYSPKNKAPLDNAAQRIIDHMNQNFDKFLEAGTAGEEIVFTGCEKVFAERIITVYNYKKCKFFITNNYLIFPVSNILDFFNIRAMYRVKRSGSTYVGTKDLKRVSDYILEKGYNIDEFIFDGKKLFAISKQNLHKRKFIFGKYEYMFSEKNDNKYEVRKLSNTFNSNVIFDVSLKNNVSKTDINDFLKSIG